MTQKEKQLLLKDICTRLPHGVKVAYLATTFSIQYVDRKFDEVKLDGMPHTVSTSHIRPYLRTISSMTKEEKEELLNLLFDKDAKCFYIDEEGTIDGKTSYLMKEGINYPAFCTINIILYTDWLNAHHFDFRNLIEKGLAIDCTGLNIY